MSRDTTGATLEQILDSDAEDKLYSIGEVSKICNVSKKALRFYDKIGLIAPGLYFQREQLSLLQPRNTALRARHQILQADGLQARRDEDPHGEQPL